MKQEEYDALVAATKAKFEEITRTSETVLAKVTEANAKLEEFKSKAQESQALYTAIQGIQANLETLRQNVEAKKNEAEVRLNEIITFHSSQYIPLRDQILDPTTGLQAILTDAQKKESTLTSYEEQAKIHFDNLKNSVEQYNNILKSLNDTQTSITDFFESSKTTAKEYLTQIQAIKADSDNILQNIKEVEKNSIIGKNNIDVLQNEAKTTTEVINSIKDESEAIKKKINTIYEQATQDMQGGAFGTYVKFLEKELSDWAKKIRNWTWILIVTIILLFLVQVALNDWSMKDIGASFYLRFTFTTPIIFYLAFCTRQYALVRINMDKYTFKKIMALSVEAHTELLKTNYPTHEKERKEFSLNVLNKIYETPYYDEKMKVDDKHREDGLKYGIPLKWKVNGVNTEQKETHKNGETVNDSATNPSTSK